MSATLPRQKITFGEMRAGGVRGLLIYCADYHCDKLMERLAKTKPEPRKTGGSSGESGKK
jgi:hypothetical protein